MSINRKHAGANSWRKLTDNTVSRYEQPNPHSTETLSTRNSAEVSAPKMLSGIMNDNSDTQSPSVFETTKVLKYTLTHRSSQRPQSIKHIEIHFALSHTLELTAPKTTPRVDLSVSSYIFQSNSPPVATTKKPVISEIINVFFFIRTSPRTNLWIILAKNYINVTFCCV